MKRMIFENDSFTDMLLDHSIYGLYFDKVLRIRTPIDVAVYFHGTTLESAIRQWRLRG